jgi:starvation-inducible DNA-binding protein
MEFVHHGPQLAGLAQQHTCLCNDLLADRRGAQRLGPAVEQLHIEFFLQFAQLHGKRWLRNLASRRCPHEMAVVVERNDVLELLQGHIDGSYIGIETINVFYHAGNGNFASMKKKTKRKSRTATNSLGLDIARSAALVEGLNVLLATYQVHYQNLRGCHWNITGPTFFELHAKFEELYTKAQTFIDVLAERVLTLEGRPLHTYTAYLKHSAVKEQRDVSGSKETVAGVKSDMTTLIALQRKALKLADAAGDEATVTMVGDNITAMEKDLWMLRAYSGK